MFPSTTAHHGLAAHEVVLLLDADPHRGLSSEDATDRLARFGPNTLPAAKGASLPMRILRQFHHPLIYVLLAAGVITAGLGWYVDSWCTYLFLPWRVLSSPGSLTADLARRFHVVA